MICEGLLGRRMNDNAFERDGPRHDQSASEDGEQRVAERASNRNAQIGDFVRPLDLTGEYALQRGAGGHADPPQQVDGAASNLELVTLWLAGGSRGECGLGPQGASVECLRTASRTQEQRREHQTGSGSPTEA